MTDRSDRMKRYANTRFREDWYERVSIQGGSSDMLPGRCGKYVGDNDATCPQLTCVREEGHPGLCDNVSDLDDERVKKLTELRNRSDLVLDEIGIEMDREILAHFGVVGVDPGEDDRTALVVTRGDGAIEFVGEVRVQEIKATTRKLRARWTPETAEEVCKNLFNEEALAAAAEALSSDHEVHVSVPPGASSETHVYIQPDGSVHAQTEVSSPLTVEALLPTGRDETHAEIEKLVDDVAVIMGIPREYLELPKATRETMERLAKLVSLPDVQTDPPWETSAPPTGPDTAPAEQFFITYKVPALTGDETLEAGPYPTIEEARKHYADIFGYEGVQQVEIVGRPAS